jgi:hypothetical protein
MRHHSFLILFLLSCFILTACTSGENTPDSQPTNTAKAPTTLAKTNTPLPSVTASPVLTNTATPVDTNTPQPTFTFTPSMTLSPTPTEFLGFQDAKVYKAFAYYDETIFHFIVPSVESNYYGTVDGVPMTCELESGYENALLCRAQADLFGTDVKRFEFFTDQARTFLVHSGDFSTTLNVRPPTPTPSGFIWPRADYTAADVTWGVTPPGCTERGVNLSCEIEYRKYADGSCLVGQSCWDSCGFYYSVDTIKDKTGPWESTGPCW